MQAEIDIVEGYLINDFAVQARGKIQVPSMLILIRNQMNVHELRIWLAGVPGFEPGSGEIKTRCLTAWLYPNFK